MTTAASNTKSTWSFCRIDGHKRIAGALNEFGKSEFGPVILLWLVPKILHAYSSHCARMVSAQRDWRARHTDKYKLTSRSDQKKRQAARRKDVIDFFGGRCARCGFSDPRALQIDHVFGDGYKERRLYSKTQRPSYNPANYFKKVIEDGGKNYQLLCANCNWIKRHENNECRRAG